MDTNQGYVTFEDWFDECEGFSTRGYRLFDQLIYVSVADRERIIRHWMEAAWEEGRRSMLWENA